MHLLRIIKFSCIAKKVKVETLSVCRWKLSHAAVNLQQKAIVTRRCASRHTRGLDQEDKATVVQSTPQPCQSARETRRQNSDNRLSLFWLCVTRADCSANMVQPCSAKTFFLSLWSKQQQQSFGQRCIVGKRG